MNIVQTALVFAGIPLAIIALMFAIIYLPAILKHSTRYRPGKDWVHEPLWYLPHPVEGTAAVGHGPAAIEGAHAEPELVEAVGGASGEW